MKIFREALYPGSKRFRGNLCLRCHGNERLILSSECVRCKNWRDRQDYAKSKYLRRILYPGQIHYQGRPCYECGQGIRYVKSGKCVRCERQRKKVHYNKQSLDKAHAEIAMAIDMIMQAYAEQEAKAAKEAANEKLASKRRNPVRAQW